MSDTQPYTILPFPAPSDPMPLVEEWLQAARASGSQRNPDAMALATAGETGRPSVRMVLMRGLSVKHGYGVFYTHYGSRKGAELAQNPWAAGVIYWEQLGRQVRFEGPVVQSPAEESDRYFSMRPWRSQINAWTSAQSAPLADPGELARRAERMAADLGAQGEGTPGTASRIARPAFWGGYRLWLQAVELWAEGADRFHDRIRYERQLDPRDDMSFSCGAWSNRRLQP